MQEFEKWIRDNGMQIPKCFAEGCMNYSSRLEEKGIYDYEELVERNLQNEVLEYAPGHIVIGDDGGGNVYLMKADLDERSVIKVGAGSMNPKDGYELVTKDFQEWLVDDDVDDSEIDNAECDYVNLIASKIDDNYKKEVLILKKIFDISIPTVSIIQGIGQGDFVLLERYPIEKARVILQNVNLKSIKVDFVTK